METKEQLYNNGEAPRTKRKHKFYENPRIRDESVYVVPLSLCNNLSSRLTVTTQLVEDLVNFSNLKGQSDPVCIQLS